MVLNPDITTAMHVLRVLLFLCTMLSSCLFSRFHALVVSFCMLKFRVLSTSRKNKTQVCTAYRGTHTCLFCIYVPSPPGWRDTYQAPDVLIVYKLS